MAPSSVRLAAIPPLLVVFLALAGCGAVTRTRFLTAIAGPLVAPVGAADGMQPLAIYEGDAVQPAGFVPIALIRGEGTWFVSRSAMIDELAVAARDAGCTVLFVGNSMHNGPIPHATGLCGVIEDPRETVGADGRK